MVVRDKGAANLPFVLLILCGVFLRALRYFISPMHDIWTYILWGQRVASFGWESGYTGTYFPIAWQLFSFHIELGDYLDVTYQYIFSVLGAIAEIFVLYLLVRMLNREMISRRTVLLIWLNPLLIVTYVTGYVDSYMVAWSLLLFYFTQKSFQSNSKLAKSNFHMMGLGAICSIGLMYKPQSAALVVFYTLGIIFLLMNNWFRLRNLKSVTLHLTFFLVPIFLMILFWARVLDPKNLARGTGRILEDILLSSGQGGSGLSFNMPNIWHLVARLERLPGQRVYEVAGTQTQHIVAAAASAIAAIVLIYLASKRMFRTSELLTWEYLVVCSTAVLIFVPMFGTNAHENHFVIGAVALNLIGQKSPSLKPFRSSMLLLTFVYSAFLALNIFGDYVVQSDTYSWLWDSAVFDFTCLVLSLGISILLFRQMSRSESLKRLDVGLSNN